MANTINDIVINIFKEFNYQIEENTERSDACLLSSGGVVHDYWLIVNEFSLDNQAQTYNQLKNKAKDEYFAKNASLLYLKHQDSINLSRIDEDILKIENDPFYFKKYVLPYTTDSERGLINILSSSTENTISDAIMQIENFKQLQVETNYGAYHLLYSLAHKLPFMTMNVKHKSFKALKTTYQGSEEEQRLLDQIQSLNEDTLFNKEVMKKIFENEEK